ncbi:MAG: DUF5104 domain-containing protein [Oscillospiraceae bacterium]|nr:DUF5104 domain-containing protein [Oscillospiraceae bacterium]
MKRKIALFLAAAVLLFCAFAFSGCNTVQRIADGIRQSEEDSKTANAQGEIVFECFENRDEETLKSLFSQSVISNGNIEEEIKEAFELYHGNAVEYSVGNLGINNTYDDGVVTKKGVIVNITVTTDTGEKYRISVRLYLSWDSEPTNIGIYVITMCLLNYEDDVYNMEGDIYRHIGGHQFLH